MKYISVKQAAELWSLSERGERDQAHAHCDGKKSALHPL